MKNNVKRLLSLVVAVLMAFSVSASALTLEAGDTSLEMVNSSRVLESKTAASYDLSAIRNGRTFAVSGKADDEIAADQIVTIMVELADAPAMEVYSQYKAATAYANSLREKQDVAVKKIRKDLNVDVDVMYNYTLLFNGFSFMGEYRLVEELNKMEGVNAFVAAEWDCPEIQLFNSTDMVGAINAWDLDYTGAGAAIAIVDTGMMVDHPAFSNEPEEDTLRFTQDDISAAIAGGHLQGAGNSSLTLSNVWYSAKIPFRWNYVHNNYNVAHVYNDHGTHVAGIAAGNGGEIQGVAKDAQLVAMQVFGDSGGAGWGAILAALEDCVVLGVDAANLSLGSPCGFSTYYAPSYASTFENLVNAGVNLSMSAGNENTTAEKNRYGYPADYNPDYGVVGSPSSWPESLSIASVDNSKSSSYTIENVATGSLYSYTENDENAAKLVATFGGQTLDFVAVPGYGELGDYANIDVNGKVAVVSRGETTFVEKGQNAQANGAIACIIYNNTDGSINMVSDPSITIPFVFVLKDSGDEMAAQGQGQIIINTEQSIMDVPGGGQPSSFSSWGPTSDLHIKPEITAPGGNIYSSTDPRPSMSGAYYQAWSGTSMSAPHVAGGMAIVTSYVNEMFPDLSTAEKQNMVDTILMSTANPVEDKDGAFAAVRSQGAGLMDLADAVTTTSYITVPGSVRPKLELGDDPDYTGVFEFTFTVNNFGETDLSYVVEPFVLMDDLAAIAYGPDAEHPYVIGRTMTSLDITAYCEIEAPETIMVPAGETKDVDVTITLADEELIDYILYYYPAGNYIEGFIELYAQGGMNGDVNGDGEVNSLDAIAVMRYAMGLQELDNLAAADVNGDGKVDMADALLIMRAAMGLEEGVVAGGSEKGADLNVPFLGFYGDWNYAPMFDLGFYYDDFSWGFQPDSDNIIGSVYNNQVFGLGINPYVETDDLSYYNEDRNAVSPNEDGFLDTAEYLRVGLLRNSADAGYELIEPNGNVVTLSHQEEVRKSFYYSSGGYYTNLGTDMGMPRWNAATYMNQDVALRIYANLANDGAVSTNAYDTEDNMFGEWIIPIYVDGAAPTAEVASFANGVLTLDVTDEHYVAYVGAFEGEVSGDALSLSALIAQEGLFEEERGMTSEVVFEGVADGDIICLADYAGNEIAYMLQNGDLVPVADSWSHQSGSGEIPDLDIYCYAKGISAGGPGTPWLAFNTKHIGDYLGIPGNMTSDTSNYKCGGAVIGAKIYGVDENNQLVFIDASASNWVGPRAVGTLTNSYYELAYNPADGNLYGVSGFSYIYQIDPERATETYVCDLEYGAVAMSFDEDGTLYVVDVYGALSVVDLATGAWQYDVVESFGINPVNLSSGNVYAQCGAVIGNWFMWIAVDYTITDYSQIRMIATKLSTGDYVDLGNPYIDVGSILTIWPKCIFGFENEPVEIPESSVDPVDFYENFESADFNWDTVDADGDGMTWEVKYWEDGLYQDGSRAAVSYSWYDEILYPDNYMISQPIEIGEGEKFLSYFTASANTSEGADIDEHWQVLVIPEGMSYEDGIVVDEQIMTTAAVTEYLVDLSDFAGETVQIAFRHFDCFDEYTLIIDSIGIGNMK